MLLNFCVACWSPHKQTMLHLEDVELVLLTAAPPRCAVCGLSCAATSLSFYPTSRTSWPEWRRRSWRPTRRKRRWNAPSRSEKAFKDRMSRSFSHSFLCRMMIFKPECCSNRKAAKHDDEIQHLYEEMEQQIKNEQDRIVLQVQTDSSFPSSGPWFRLTSCPFCCPLEPSGLRAVSVSQSRPGTATVQ